ncbi:EGF-containing fibulin-like extracellular matrix protein 1 [Physella acuta]|uniref:EGF-containing fibulin-like extracellular matrix protein 1 n=1 Tax=Physella acuta TaxID=109671 RepID=UPI0027DBEDFC|nr:EGF-containing fibulin-like extracellular matrix protein 1 [Physella acuta]
MFLSCTIVGVALLFLLILFFTEKRDEGVQVNTNQCEQISINLNGSLVCSCEPGYKISSIDPNQCEACNATHYGLNCANTCSCNLNNTVDCNDTTGECLCAAGWNGTTCDEDVNECLNASYCPDYMEVCFNLVGSAECRCEIGFQRSLIDLQCKDIDECNIQTASPCEHICNNTNGSFLCSCNSGYEINKTDTTRCVDINECSSGSPCEQICTNTEGSFLCSCYPRFFINITNSNKCETSCNAYPTYTAVRRQISTRKECFELCVNQSCFYFEYFKGYGCFPSVTAGSPVDTSIDASLEAYVGCSNVSSQCAPYGKRENRLTNVANLKECYTTCVADPLCWEFIRYKNGTCTTVRMKDPASIDIEESSRNYVSCAFL